MKRRIKTLEQFVDEQINESTFKNLRLIDTENLWKMTGYSKNPEDWVGSFGHKEAKTDYILLKLDEYDKEWLKKSIKLKAGENVFRYETEKTKIAKMKPLVKVNINKGLVYFLENPEDDKPVFTKKGIKVDFLNLRKDYYEGRADKSFYFFKK